MSTIAQQLCDEIVDPERSQDEQDEPEKLTASTSGRITTSPKKITRPAKRCPSSSCSQSNHKNTTRSVLVERKRVINQLIPKLDSGKALVVNKIKSREILMNKKFIDTSVNTLFSGPLRCDTMCTTATRKRGSGCNCKCSQKYPSKSCVKQVQAFEYRTLGADKACDQEIKNVTCGTQFKHDLLFGGREKSANITDTAIGPSRKSSIAFKVKSSFKFPKSSIQFDRDESCDSNSYDTKLFMGARRWALTRYPTRGPDF